MPRVETRGSENEEKSKERCFSQCAVMNNESFYHDMQNDEVMCQTIQGFAGYRNPFNSRVMRP